MRKTSQDGGDTTSITESGIENEAKRIGTGIMKATRNSIKKKVQSLSHDSDEAVIEPLLQKDKPEIANQSAKYSILKTKTEMATEKSSDKEKLISDNMTKSSTSIAPSVAISTAGTSHNYMNANKFGNLDVKKVDVTNQGEVLVKIEGTKQNIYNPSPLIFTTAKIHTDSKNKHLEPVQVAPAPILSTIEGGITTSGNDIEQKTNYVSEKDKNMTVKEKQNIQEFPVEIKKALSAKPDKTVNYVDQSQQMSSVINKVSETENSVTKPKESSNSTIIHHSLEQKEYDQNKSTGTTNLLVNNSGESIKENVIDLNKNFPNISTSSRKEFANKKLPENAISTDISTKKMSTQSSLAGSKQLQRQKNATPEDTCDLDAKKQSKNEKTNDSKILKEKTEELSTISKSMVKSEETAEDQKKTVSLSDGDAVKSLSAKSVISSSSISPRYQYVSTIKTNLPTAASESIATDIKMAAPITETTKVLSVTTVKPFTNYTISSKSSIKAKTSEKPVSTVNSTSRTGVEIVNKLETATKDKYSESTATPVVSKTSTLSSLNSSNGCISVQSLKQAEAAIVCKSTTNMSANQVSIGVSSTSNLKSTNAVKPVTTTKSKSTKVMDTLTNSPPSLHSSHEKSFSNPTSTVSSSTINSTKPNISSKPYVNKNSDSKKDCIKSSRA